MALAYNLKYELKGALVEQINKINANDESNIEKHTLIFVPSNSNLNKGIHIVSDGILTPL